MMNRLIYCSLLVSLVFCSVTQAAEKPNIVFILADDWGLGDVKCFGGDLCRIETPNMDALAAAGMKFTDAHSSSSVCTPTRYGVLTGRYNWRSRLKSGVLYGFSNHLIQPKRITVAEMLKEQGYTTGCVGKWHLGMDFPTTDGQAAFAKFSGADLGKPMEPGQCNVDWKGKIANGPTTVGFDYYYGISASLDMPPYIWIEDDHFVGECTTVKAFHRPGPAHADFFDYDVLPTIAEKSAAFIRKQAKTDNPFFLYVPLNSPHTPISPSKKFQGKSGLGTYADFVMETDWAIGEIVKAIDESGAGKNTLVMVSADNGCSPAAKRGDDMQLNITFNMTEGHTAESNHHYPSGVYRGHKADIYEGGHRVPFIARWTGTIEKNSECSAPICLVDLFATSAELAHGNITESEAVDSISFASHLLGKKDAQERESVIHHSINGSFAIRSGDWKLAFCPGSGGWSSPRPQKRKRGAKLEAEKNKSEVLHFVQLYDLSKDPTEQKNVAKENPEVVAKLTKAAQSLIDDGRSTKGPMQSNEGTTNLYPGWLLNLIK